MNNKSASICIIGSELTKGIIEDKHSKVISQELNKLNIVVNQISIINDDGSIEDILKSWLNDNDMIFVTGGLGPTSDDLTRISIANVANKKLVENEKAYKTLYKMVGKRIHGANYSQALIPEDFTLLENPNGTAPGFMGSVDSENGETVIFSMPGPPRELKPMFYNLVLPWVKNYIGYSEKLTTELSTFLICESKLEEACTRLKIDNVKWGTRFQENKISLFVSGENSPLMISSLRALVGKELIVDDNIEAIDVLINDLIQNDYTIGCAESCTGGLCAKLLTDRSGSSAFFEGGIVSYSNSVKNKVLNVNSSILENYGAVSKETVLEMATNARTLLNTDVAFSISGIAGPNGGTIDKPVGTVWFGFSKSDLPPQAVKLCFTITGRNGIRKRAAVAAFLLTSLYLKGYSLLDIIDKWEYI
ncbi:MAG: nicotinamide-nucleotide amidohydrolase family protein [Sphaerochaetaceae bacterium]|nr:nicotinamide-nucleotide amidohydrolase family protein [Sphaerochaetaceae bacterium]MDC7236661.1 nicotinamide-nucleotide amidohydrolase family protein [Sphaerochaetaceae bacterium]MDC7248366.1 nicotinamide-nucleotide amidohydrolase family protein [Sphaerochaetaceae bacterium]